MMGAGLPGMEIQAHPTWIGPLLSDTTTRIIIGYMTFVTICVITYGNRRGLFNHPLEV